MRAPVRLSLAAATFASLVNAGIPASANGLFLPVPVKQSMGDTTTMTCAHAQSLVHGAGGTLLHSGPNRYDLYHRGGGYCYRLQQVGQAAYVPTRDDPQCFIGYTCVEPDYDQPFP